MILVIGATGWLGREICRQLTEKDLPVRAMVRPISEPAKVAELKNMGAIPVVGDLRDPVTFMSVLEGVDTVIATVSSMPFSYVPGDNDMQRVDEAGMIRFIESAQQAGVRHFIYTSFSGDFGLDFPLAHAKRSVEGHLHQSGMTYTILRPSCFMEAWLTPAVGFDVANRQVTIYGDGTQKVSYISLRDVAQFAVASLDNLRAENATLELGGPEGISQLEAVGIFEDLTGDKIAVQHVPTTALLAQSQTAKDPMEQSFTGLMLGVAQGNEIPMEDMLHDFPVTLTSVRSFAEGMLTMATPA